MLRHLWCLQLGALAAFNTGGVKEQGASALFPLFLLCALFLAGMDGKKCSVWMFLPLVFTLFTSAGLWIV